MFRKIIKARAILDKSGGDFPTFARACRAIDPLAGVKDNRDMTVTVSTDFQDDFTHAENAGALPRSAGVRVIYEDASKFGFDGAGEGFDQARTK